MMWWKRRKPGRSVPMLEGAMNLGAMEDAIRLWTRMYQGDPPWREEGETGLNLAAYVASEAARLTTVELGSRVTAREAGGAARAAYLDGQYQPVLDAARRFVELAAATGTVALKPYVAGRRIVVDAVAAGRFFPTRTGPGGEVVGCLFVDYCQADGRWWARVEEHRLEADGYRVTNRAWAVDGPGARDGRAVPLRSVPQWADLLEDAFLPGVDRPLFALLRMPHANTADVDSPLGASIYARAAELIREADKQFGRLIWEMESGQRALYVDVRAFAPEDTEAGPLPFKRMYRTMDVDPQGQELFAEWSPPLRDAGHLAALNEILQRVEDQCALARGTLSEAPESAARGPRTATELKITRQRTHAMVRETQKALEVALRGLLGAMDVWASVYGLAPEGAWEVSFDFDDSVVSDRSEAFDERVRLAEMGVIRPWELRAWYLGESEEAARGRLTGDG